MKTIDFRNSRWGHAIHGWTMTAQRGETLLQRLKDWHQGALRASVIVHSSQCPKVGDKIRYEAENYIVEAPIYKVKPCGNPSDMYTLFIRITPESRK